MRQKLRLITRLENNYNLMEKFLTGISLFLKEKMHIFLYEVIDLFTFLNKEIVKSALNKIS